MLWIFSLSRRVVREREEAYKSFAQRSHRFMNVFALCQVTKQRSSDFNLTNQSSHQKNARPWMCFNAELFIKWFLFITPSPSPPLPSLLSHILREEPRGIYFMHRTFRAGRDDHYLSHPEALPDKSFLEVDRPLKCSHWVREMNSSCVLLFQQFRKGLGKGDHGALEYKQTAGTHSWDKRHLFSGTAGLFKFNLHGTNLLKKTLVPRKTWRLKGTILSYLGFGATNAGPLGKKGQLSKTKWFLSEVF